MTSRSMAAPSESLYFANEYRPSVAPSAMARATALSSSLQGDGFSTAVELQGIVPSDVNRVEVVVENETGLHVLPVVLD